MKRWPPHPVRTLLAGASLRVRVMAAAAILVTVTSAVMGLLGTTLLRGYLIERIDTQLRGLSSALARVSPRPPPARFRHSLPRQPSSFFMEIIGPDGHVRVSPDSVRDIPPPRLTTAQLHGSAGPFTAGGPGPQPAILRGSVAREVLTYRTRGGWGRRWGRRERTAKDAGFRAAGFSALRSR